MGKVTRYFAPEADEPKSVSTPRAGRKTEPNSKPSPLVPGVETIIAKTNKRKKFTAKNTFKDKRKRKSLEKSGGAPDPFPDPPEVPKATLRKYSRGTGLSAKTPIKTSIQKEKIIRHDEKIKKGLEQAARTEILLLEEPGGEIEVEQGESSLQLKQLDLVKHVDSASATKSFQLNLKQFAPYQIDYTLNGRHLALGGRKGHVAAFDWVTKRLLCEFNVMESVHDVKWLHNETLFAVAQNKWTYVYDNQGIEVHCLKKLDRVMKLDFLPYHFLLVGGHQSGFLSWVDVSIGKIVAQFGTRKGPLGVLTSNPSNAIVHCGHPNGVVSLWSPNVKEPMASILCHGSAVSSIAVDSVGRLMATGAWDGTLRIWDLRNSFAPLTSIKVGKPSSLAFSQRGLLSVSTNNLTMVFNEIGQNQKPFLKHVGSGNVASTQFCPFEDILGIGTSGGFDSIIVPGAGEANFDALERNPYQTKSQRKEAEVKALLEKIQPELISMDNSLLGEVDTDALQKELDSKPKFVKKADIELSHRRKRKSAKIPKAKQALQSELKLRAIRELDQREKRAEEESEQPTHADPLDRFIRKKRK